jgi:hypothetical protein
MSQNELNVEVVRLMAEVTKLTGEHGQTMKGVSDNVGKLSSVVCSDHILITALLAALSESSPGTIDDVRTRLEHRRGLEENEDVRALVTSALSTLAAQN